MVASTISLITQSISWLTIAMITGVSDSRLSYLQSEFGFSELSGTEIPIEALSRAPAVDKVDRLGKDILRSWSERLPDSAPVGTRR